MVTVHKVPTVRSGGCAKGLLAKAPLLVAGRQGPVAVGLGEGVVAIYAPVHLHFDAHRDFTVFEVRSHSARVIQLQVPLTLTRTLDAQRSTGPDDSIDREGTSMG